MSKNKNTYPEIHRKYIYIQQIGLSIFFLLGALCIILAIVIGINDISKALGSFFFNSFFVVIISAVLFNISLYFYYIYFFKKILKTELPFWLVPDQSIVIHDMINKDQKKI
tara:strand:+ start:1008 stop:1340 length:333 start_codon:yes stop_codon:yes gene_type:complete